MPPKNPYRDQELANFYQRWRLLYIIRNPDFFQKHASDWDLTTFPDSEQILQQELAVKEENSPSWKWPAGIDPVQLDRFAILQAVRIKNRDAMNIPEQIHIDGPRSYDIELLQLELKYVYWQLRTDKERPEYKNPDGSKYLGAAREHHASEARKAWRELIHYKIKGQYKGKSLKPAWRAAGLWLWDYDNENRCGADVAIQALKDRWGDHPHFAAYFSGRDFNRAGQDHEQNNFLKLFDRTTKCIQEADVLPL